MSEVNLEKEMSFEELEKKVGEFVSNHSVGLTQKRELALVQEPSNPYLMELVNRRFERLYD